MCLSPERKPFVNRLGDLLSADSMSYSEKETLEYMIANYTLKYPSKIQKKNPKKKFKKKIKKKKLKKKKIRVSHRRRNISGIHGG